MALFPACVTFPACVSARKACPLRSARCRHAANADTHFRCPGKGQFVVPDTTLRFYKCLGAQYRPCECTCKYAHMCFDGASRRCRPSLLPAVNNCSTPSGPPDRGSVEPRGALPPDDSLRVAQNNFNKTTLRFHKHKPAGNEVLKPGRTEDLAALDVSTPGQEGHTGPPELERLAARQAPANGLPDVIEDNSIFPAWAISLLVLCVVILLVLVVMVLY